MSIFISKQDYKIDEDAIISVEKLPHPENILFENIGKPWHNVVPRNYIGVCVSVIVIVLAIYYLGIYKLIAVIKTPSSWEH